MASSTVRVSTSSGMNLVPYGHIARLDQDDFVSRVGFTDVKVVKREGVKKLNAFMNFEGRPSAFYTDWSYMNFDLRPYQYEGKGPVRYTYYQNNSVPKHIYRDDWDSHCELRRNFFTNMVAIRDVMHQWAAAHSETIFGEEYEVSLMKALCKYKVDYNDQYDSFNMTVSIPKEYGTERPNITLFVTKGDGTPGVRETLETFDDLLPFMTKGTCVRSLVKPRIWMVGGKVGLTWVASQIEILQRRSMTISETYGFPSISVSAVEAAEAVEAAAAAGAGAGTGAGGFPDGGEESEELELDED